MTLQSLLRKCESGLLSRALETELSSTLACQVDRAPQVMYLAVDHHFDLIEAPNPLAGGIHPAHTLTRDIGRKKWTDLAPSVPDHTVTDVDRALSEQILNILTTEREAKIHHHRLPDDFRRRAKVAKRGGVLSESGHPTVLAYRTHSASTVHLL